MFYEGDLQSGIAKAVQESKLVVCFVTDAGEESQVWESEYLSDASIKAPLLEHAVSLRLKAGSPEAGYLAAIFPLPKTPTIVVIRNGELKEYIVTGVTKEQLINRLLVALGGTSAVTSSQPVDSSPQPSAAVQDLLAERRARLEVHKKETEAREKAKKEAEARKRKEELAAAIANDPKASAEKKHAVQLKKAQQQARDDRARILKRVEDDKAERREREAERKRQAADAKSQDTNKGEPMQSSTARSASECAIQVRLFDGSTIRSRFPAQGSLTRDVRPWILGKQEGDHPFTFKQVLTPLPNKTIETSEEEKSLQSLGLTPNATLILVPVSTYTSAYQPTGLVGSAVSTGYGLVSSGCGAVTGLLGSVLGGNAAASSSSQGQDTTSVASGSTIRTTSTGDKRDKRQYYNGNSTAFEPRRDDDDQKKQD